MNSFTLTAIGNLSDEPVMMARDEMLYTRFCLIANDYGGRTRDGQSREIVTGVWFVAFGALGEAIALNARKGDQLIVTAQLRANNWVDRQGNKHYGYSYVVRGFRFGAPGKSRRAELSEKDFTGDLIEAASAEPPRDPPLEHCALDEVA